MRAALATIFLVAACGPAPRPQPIGPTGPDEPTPPPPTTPTSQEPPMATFPSQTATPQELAFPDEPFRNQQPEAGAPRPFRLPKVHRFRLANGIQAYLVEQHELPLVSMELSFDGGGLLDPKGKEGLSSLCMGMLTEGTEALDKIQYAEALADIASSISAYATDDTMGIGLSSLTKHLDPTFAQFVQTLRTPAFRASDFDRMVKRRIEAVRQSKGSPASVASRVNGAILYGSDHPFGAVTTEASLAAITPDDCKAFAKRYFKPAAAELFVVGDLTEAQVRKLFAHPALAGWKGAQPRIPAPRAPRTHDGRIFFVHIPGAAQSQVQMLHFGPARKAPDYFATTLMASVFGGSFSSRINMNLRENKGYSYGARGGFGYSKYYGAFTASASVRSDATYQTLLEMRREVTELASGKRPVDKTELDRERQGAILGLPGQFATGRQALAQYRRLVYYGLGLGYYDNLVGRLQRVTEAQVKAAARKHLKPDRAVYLVVGDGDAAMVIHQDGKDVPYLKDGKPVTLRAALAELVANKTLGAGALVELDADGRRPK